MIFKKKYKRSSWMEGFLEGELLKSFGHSDFEIKEAISKGQDYIVNLVESFKGNTPTILISNRQYVKGVMDYLKYFEENKEILSKWLDK